MGGDGARGHRRDRRRRARDEGRARRPLADRRLVPVRRALVRRPTSRPHSVLADWHDVSGAASAAWVPVVHDDRAVGVLAVGWPSTFARRCPQRDEELLRLLAAEAAITIHRTDLLARLQSTARTDPLTGLPNRRVWDEDLEREIARARRHGGSLCLAMLDLDRFKAFNDEYGHQAGDQLLAATAAAWRPALRATDTIARYGGEEFARPAPAQRRGGRADRRRAPARGRPARPDRLGRRRGLGRHRDRRSPARPGRRGALPRQGRGPGASLRGLSHSFVAFACRSVRGHGSIIGGCVRKLPPDDRFGHTPSPDGVIAALAARQHGLVTIAQLLAAGPGSRGDRAARGAGTVASSERGACTRSVTWRSLARARFSRRCLGQVRGRR